MGTSVTRTTNVGANGFRGRANHDAYDDSANPHNAAIRLTPAG